MKDINNKINKNAAYQKEEKLQNELQDEFIRITRNNLKNTMMKYEYFANKLIKSYSNKRLIILKEYCSKNLNEEQSKVKLKEENDKLNETLENIVNLIEKDLEKIYNDNINDFILKMNEIFDTGSIDVNILHIYNSIKNNEYSSQRINEHLNDAVKKYEEVFRNYLLKKMKYKEELEIYNLRQQQIINENIDSKKDYSDINNYLNNFKNNANANNDYKKLSSLVQSIKEFNEKNEK